MPSLAMEGFIIILWWDTACYQQPNKKIDCKVTYVMLGVPEDVNWT